ncbi:phage tail tape measure protein (plasmid) [Bacillus safensis subsp. safensis]|uniref:phage tail tape measure protein n=1 Tax=Bacillus safensis TaxID=561879 RepID=UPI0037BF7C37
MSEEGKGIGLSAEILLGFEQSIKNIQAFGSAMEGLDHKFGSLEQRINSAKTSLLGLQTQTAGNNGRNLRESIQQEIDAALKVNGIAMSMVGNAPLEVKKDTVRHLFARVDAELNRAILKQVGNINIQLDPNYNTGTIPIGKDEFNALNKEIARLVKLQTKNLTDSIKGVSGSVSPENLSGLDLDISKDTVKHILSDIRKQLNPIILNPSVDTEGLSLKFTSKEFEPLIKQIKNRIREAVHVDIGKLPAGENKVSTELKTTTKKIDALIEGYAKNIRLGMNTIDPRTVEVPMKSLSKRLQRHIADSLNTNPQELTKTLKTIDTGSAKAYELQRQFSSLERTINNKVTAGISGTMKSLRQSVREFEMHPNSSVKHYLIQELGKLNNDIIKKIRESVDMQFSSLRGEINAAQTNAKALNRNGKLKGAASYGAGGGNVYNNTVINNNNAQRKDSAGIVGNDPYSRRDNYFNGHGIEGAVTNTVRHVVAGSMVGVPLMQVYEAVEQFKASQLEQLKIMQNYALKPEYKDENNRTDWSKVNSDINKMTPDLHKMSNLYAVSYGEMNQVAAVASRLTEDKASAMHFTDQASKIYRLDNESNLVEVIAPGLEAIMAQFKLSVWELDGVVNAFGVATQLTKSTSDEVMKALTRSGSALHSAKVSAPDAVALNALAIQTSGQSGENIGNAMKTIAARVTLPSVTNKLESYGIKVFEENDMGLKVRRGLVDILADTSRVAKSKYMGEDEIQSILYGEGGGYQYPKLMSFLDGMNKAGIDSSGGGLSYWRIKQEVDEWQKDPSRLQEMLATTMNAPTITLERAGVSVQNSLVSVLEELNPELQNLAKIITNLAQGIENNSELFAQLTGILANALIGFGALYGVKKVGKASNYDEHYANAQMAQRYFGGNTLTGRQVYGGKDFLNNHVLGDSRELRGRLGDQKFYNAAMKNDTLKGYFTELSNLDNDRRREIRQYISDRNGKVNNLPDLFSVMDESRGYRRERVQGVTAEDMHARAAYSARNIMQDRVVQSAFTKEFADQLTSSLSDKDKFNQLDDHQRGTANRLGSMSESKRADFKSYLDTDYMSVGKAIGNVDDLNKALDEFEKKNREAHNESRRGSEAYRDLGRAVRSVASEAENATKGRMQGFLNMVDSIPQRARGAGNAMIGLAKNIGGVAKQMALAVAVGDVLSSNAETLALTEKQEKIRDFRTVNNDSGEAWAKLQGDMNSGNFTAALARGGGLLWNTVIDAFTAGNAKVGVNDVKSFQDEMSKWMQKEYGTNDASAALKAENAKRAKEANGGTYTKATYEDLANKYLQDSGKFTDLQDMEKDNFLEEYKKFAISESEQNMRRAQAERARKAWENNMIEDGEYDYFSYEDLKTRIDDSKSSASRDGQLNLLNSLLNGVKSDSETYMKFRLQAIAQEREAYKKEIADLRTFIQEREKELALLEKAGKQYTIDPDTGEKTETKEYKKMRESVENNKDKEKKLREEFEVQDREKAVEAQRIRTDFYITNTQKEFSRSSARKQLQDTLAGLTMNTESPKYIDYQLGTSANMISEMESRLGALRAQSLADPDNTLTDAILALEQQIAGAKMEVKNLRLQRLTAWRNNFSNNMDDVEIKYLQERVNLGPGVNDDSPLARDLRIGELQDRKNIIDRQLSERVALKDSGRYAKGSSEFETIMKDIRDLTKQSLQAQLGIHQELKSQMGGTFNLPEGIAVMSQYDYMAKKGTHSSMTLQQGDAYVNIVLPNVTDKTGSKQLAQIGSQIGKGIVEGRTASLRNQINSAPWSYPKIG